MGPSRYTYKWDPKKQWYECRLKGACDYDRRAFPWDTPSTTQGVSTGATVHPTELNPRVQDPPTRPWNWDDRVQSIRDIFEPRPEQDLRWIGAEEYARQTAEWWARLNPGTADHFVNPFRPTKEGLKVAQKSSAARSGPQDFPPFTQEDNEQGSDCEINFSEEWPGHTSNRRSRVKRGREPWEREYDQGDPLFRGGDPGRDGFNRAFDELSTGVRFGEQ